jgi:hypothetical protein
MKNLPTLSMILVVNVEQDIKYLSYFLKSMGVFNAPALASGEVEFLIISQRRRSEEIFKLLGDFPFPVDVVHAKHDFVGAYPIWDVNEELRQVLPLLYGKFIAINHPEFLWLPGRLQSTVNYLKNHPNEYLVLGNLRRPGDRKRIEKEHPGHVIESSLQLMDLLDSDKFVDLAVVSETVDTCSWMFWSPEPTFGDDVPWLEDLFFISPAFIQVTNLFDHGGRLPFQDVYDLVAAAVLVLDKHHLTPKMSRMDFATNKVLHIHHPKTWGSWLPEVRDYFLNAPEEWCGTLFLDKGLWSKYATKRAASFQPPKISRWNRSSLCSCF